MGTPTGGGPSRDCRVALQLLQKQSSLQHRAVEEGGGAGALEIQELLLWLLLGEPPADGHGQRSLRRGLLEQLLELQQLLLL